MALQSLRNATHSWLFKALMILLALTFAAFFGVTGNPFQRATALITVGGVEIDSQTLLREFNSDVQRISGMLNQPLTTEQARRFGLLDQTIGRLVNQAVLDETARRAGLVVTDAQVARQIREDPQFRPAGGDFDRFAFENYLRVAGYSQSGYEVLLRRDIVQRQLLGAVGAGSTVPQVALEAIYRYRNERRVADAVTVRFEPRPDDAAPDDAAVQAHYEANRARYMAPELRAATVLFLTPTRLAEEIAVPAAEVEEMYRTQAARFATPERRAVSQVVVPADAKPDAEKIARLAAEGLDYAAAVRHVVGTDPVDLGLVTRAELALDALGEAAFKLPEGGTAGTPIESPLGWHVVHVGQVVPGHTVTLDEARDGIAREIKLRRARENIADIGAAVEDMLAGGAKFEEAAAAHRLGLLTLPAVARDGLNAEGKPITGLPSLPQALQTIFATAAGQESQLVETPDGGFHIVRVDGVTPPAVKPLEQVREEVVASWQSEERRKRAEARAGEVAKRVEGGEELAKVAAEFGLAVATTEPFLRSGGGGAGAALLGDMAARLFKLAVGKVATASAGEVYQVAQLKEIRPADPAAGDAALAQLRNSLRTALADDLETATATALGAGFSIEIDRRAIDNLFQN